MAKTLLALLVFLTIQSANAAMSNNCFNYPVGVADNNTIPDNQMTASSNYVHHELIYSYFGRLNSIRGYGWCASTCCGSQEWLQVDLGETFEVCGVATQGYSRNVRVYVTDFSLTYSVDGNSWTTYLNTDSTEMKFHRNGNGSTVDQHKLPVSVLARYIRFHPINQSIWNCLRVEVYGTLAKPCPGGQSGFYPNCTVLPDVPVPKVTYLDDGKKMVTLKCDFDTPHWGNVSFEIQWYVNGRGLGPVVCDDPRTSKCAQLGATKYSLGSHVRCDIRARNKTHPDNIWTPTKASELFYAGIEIHPSHLDVTECDANPANKLKMRPTLPIRGEDLTLRFGTWDNPKALLASQCIINLKQGEALNWTEISIQAVCDNTNQLFGSSAFTFAVTSTHQFWGGYDSAAVTISKIENPVDMCGVIGDPHYTTFDGRYYDFYRPGDFVLYRNKDRSFEIHTRLWRCWSVTCNCGVAIREKHDVIVLSACTQNLVLAYGMPMKISITSKRRLTKGTKILVRHPGGYSEYEVRFPSGTVVTIQRYSWGNNVKMEAPKSDKTKTEGMCGNLDGNPNNDFNYGGDKKAYTDPDSFGESWRVDTSKSLFHTVPPCVDEACDDSELKIDRCECTKKGGSMSIKCNRDLMQFYGMGNQGYTDRTEDFQNFNRKKRDLVYSDDIIYLYDDEQPERDVYQSRNKRAVNTKMSLANATDYCRKTILNTAAAKVCLEISGVNASNAIQSCAADLQFTGDLSWVESAFESLKSSCEFQAVKKFSAYDKDEEGNFVPPVKIAQNLCPNDCSFNGNCTNGSCICNEGFVADDCSMRVDEIPRLFRILNKGLCDIRARPCLKTIVFGENFLDSKNLTCHVKEVSVMPSKWIPSNKTKTLNGSKTDLFAVECHLPTPPIHLGNFDLEGSPAAGYIISVSNDKVHESLQALKVITFDPICLECNISQGCALKKSSCLIKSHCFAEGDPSPKDWCQLCNSSASQARWTRRIINIPPNITTPNQRYALLGEDLQLQLEGEDPENRPFVISLMSGSPPEAKLTSKGVLLWKPGSTIKRKFYFKATDECNASSTFEMTIEILTCPCTDKGTCRPNPNHPRGSGMYYCECQPGYEGHKCEKEIDECLSNPCVHGSCNDMINNYSCQCQPGYTGYNCNIEIDECHSSPCVHGTCTDMVNAFTCNCQSGFTGLRCEVNINDCPSSGCGNGTCIDLIKNYTCQCNVGFAGQHCNIIIRNCSNDSCFPGVRCIQKPNTISCDPCPSGFTGDGKICKDIDDCVSNRCTNNATCKDGFNTYSCVCQTGYTGTHCEKDIDDCVTARCANGAKCVDGVNRYSCTCKEGFTGKFCESPLPTSASTVSESSTTETSPTESTKQTSPSTTDENLNSKSTKKPVSDEHKTDFEFEIRVYKEWDDRLRDLTSDKFKEFAALLKDEILKTYSAVSELKKVTIISMRPGSVVAYFKLTFKTKFTVDEALAPLKKQTASGKLGSLEVDPYSLKPHIAKQETTEKPSAANLPLIIGVLCGSFVFLVVVSICVAFRCKRSVSFNSNSRTKDAMPTDETCSKHAKYEMQPTKCRKEENVCLEERGVWNKGME